MRGLRRHGAGDVQAQAQSGARDRPQEVEIIDRADSAIFGWKIDTSPVKCFSHSLSLVEILINN